MRPIAFILLAFYLDMRMKEELASAPSEVKINIFAYIYMILSRSSALTAVVLILKGIF